MNNETSGNLRWMVERLRQVPYLNGLGDAALAEMAAATVRKRYATGEVIILEDEVSAGLYILHAGWVKVVKLSLEGREQVLRFIGAGEGFNELGIFSHRPTPATAIALEPSDVWIVPREAFSTVLREHPEFVERLLDNLADRITYLAGMVANLSLKPVVSRLAQLLLDEAKENVVSRPQWYTQSQLAARLGTVPDVLQRALSSLVNDGVIELQRHEIRILDRQALEAITGG